MLTLGKNDLWLWVFSIPLFPNPKHTCDPTWELYLLKKKTLTFYLITDYSLAVLNRRGHCLATFRDNTGEPPQAHAQPWSAQLCLSLDKDVHTCPVRSRPHPCHLSTAPPAFKYPTSLRVRPALKPISSLKLWISVLPGWGAVGVVQSCVSVPGDSLTVTPSSIRSSTLRDSVDHPV